MACIADAGCGWELRRNAKADPVQCNSVALSHTQTSGFSTSASDSEINSGYSSDCSSSSRDFRNIHFEESCLDELKAIRSDAIDACSLSAISESLPMPDEHMGQRVIIFDYDDTLFPTSYMNKVLELDGLRDLTPTSAFYWGMCRHAQFVESLLRTARQVANVAIVTLSDVSWVKDSAKRYLPGLRIHDLLKELNIPVYYAVEHIPVTTHFVETEEVDLHVIAKRNAMNKFIQRVCRKKGAVSNVVSIGDSYAEAEALKEIAWSTLENSHCTTIRLLDTPSLEDLSDQIEHLIEALPQLVYRADDADFHMRNLRHAEDGDI